MQSQDVLLHVLAKQNATSEVPIVFQWRKIFRVLLISTVILTDIISPTNLTNYCSQELLSGDSNIQKCLCFLLASFPAYLVPLIPASPLPLTSFFSLQSVLPSYLWSCPVMNQQHLLYSQSLIYLFLCVATPSCVVCM